MGSATSIKIQDKIFHNIVKNNIDLTSFALRYLLGLSLFCETLLLAVGPATDIVMVTHHSALEEEGWKRFQDELWDRMRRIGGNDGPTRGTSDMRNCALYPCLRRGDPERSVP